MEVTLIALHTPTDPFLLTFTVNDSGISMTERSSSGRVFASLVSCSFCHYHVFVGEVLYAVYRVIEEYCFY